MSRWSRPSGRPRWFLPLVVIVLGLLLSVGGALAAPDRYILPGDAVFPEGVAYQPTTGTFFVGSTTDGTIFRGNYESGAVTVFSPGGSDGRTTAIGLKTDAERLFVSGGGTGKVWIYNTATGALITQLTLAANVSASSPTFINDVALTPDGSAYFTDSQRPFLYRVTRDAQGQYAIASLDFTGTALTYQQGFNVNGITTTADGRYLILVQSNTGRLYRVTTATGEVAAIALTGDPVTNGDGILLDGQLLYVVRNMQGEIVTIGMREEFASGTTLSRTTNPLLAYPTTIAKVGDRLLVVNSQFDKRGMGRTPELPFTVANIPVPSGASPAPSAAPSAPPATATAVPPTRTPTPAATPTRTPTPTARPSAPPSPPPTGSGGNLPGLPNTGAGGDDGLAGLWLPTLGLVAALGGGLLVRRRMVRAARRR